MSSIDLLRKYRDILEDANAVDIESVAARLEFLPTHKQQIKYKFVEDGVPGQMAPFTWTVANQPQRVITVTLDGKETENTAKPSDIIMSGPSKENYVLPEDKFKKLYTELKDGIVIPEQSPRSVAKYQGNDTVKFKASWGEDMILKPGDYLVKETSGKGYYRIAAAEYEQTYNPPGH